MDLGKDTMTSNKVVILERSVVADLDQIQDYSRFEDLNCPKDRDQFSTLKKSFPGQKFLCRKHVHELYEFMTATKLYHAVVLSEGMSSRIENNPE